MPRWPAGLHLASGAVPAAGQRPRRADATPQHHYWRHVDSELHAAASAVLVVPAQQFLPQGSPIFELAQVGPTAAGEVWRVTLVQVQLPGQYAAPPLVTEQAAAQFTGTTIQPPPPFVAQAWLAVGGTRVHLLAQTTQGGNDSLDLGGQEVSAGEAIAVQWWSTTDKGFPGLGWMVVRGIRHTLSQI